VARQNAIRVQNGVPHQNSIREHNGFVFSLGPGSTWRRANRDALSHLPDLTADHHFGETQYQGKLFSDTHFIVWLSQTEQQNHIQFVPGWNFGDI
jgi:hypothetical protein